MGPRKLQFSKIVERVDMKRFESVRSYREYEARVNGFLQKLADEKVIQSDGSTAGSCLVRVIAEVEDFIARRAYEVDD